MTGVITLTIASTDTGPFDLYSNINGYISAFAVNITRAQLLTGYSTDVIPDFATIIRIMSIGNCNNYIDVPIPTCLLIGTGVITIPPLTTTTTSSTTAAPVITSVTEINIWFDSSGSMDATLAPLETMQNTLLKNCIGPIYGYDPSISGSDALYNERVKVNSIDNERFVSWLSTPLNFNRTVDPTVNQVLNLTFADESNPYGYGGNGGAFDNTIIAAQYATDIATLRANVAANPGVIKGVAYRVATTDAPGPYPGFRALTQATFVNTGIYTPNANISDLPEFTYELDVAPGDTAAYYLTQVTSGLTTLGFTVSCTP